MHTYTFSQLTEETLETLVTLNEKYIPPAEWEKMQVALTAEECRRLDDIKSTLHHRHLVARNREHSSLLFKTSCILLPHVSAHTSQDRYRRTGTVLRTTEIATRYGGGTQQEFPK